MDVLERNTVANAHFPRISKRQRKPLAVVGGAPSVVHDLDELRTWEGDVWGINNTAQWLNENGVNATMFSVDPTPFTCKAPRAVLATVCDPMLFGQFADVECFDMSEVRADGIQGGAFSSTRAPAVALQMGYVDVSFFGCDGSFEDRDHVDCHLNDPEQLIVRAGGSDYRTLPSYLVQCEELANIFLFDNVFRNRSRGLLRAFIENRDTWEVVGVSAAMKDSLEAVNGRQGLYDEPFVGL